MRIIRGESLKFLPASHESAADPGAIRRILVARDDLLPGRLQMINWARIPAGKTFAPHYHEDMQEVFIIVSGRVEVTVGGESAVLLPGDTILVDAREVHTMRNLDPSDCDYLAIGIAMGTGGRTVLAGPQ